MLEEDRTVALIVLAFVASELVTLGWDLPSSHGWENDGIAPRDLFGGLAHNLTPGATHRYPLLHYLLLGILSLPVLVVAVVSGPLAPQAILSRVLSVPCMTAISLLAKLLAIALASVTVLALARIVRRTVDARAGRYAALFAATNLTFAFYGRVSNLDVPYLAWTLLALDALLDVLEQGSTPAYTRFGLLSAAAVATKDQAYATFLLVVPGYLVLLPLARKLETPAVLARKLVRPGLVSAVAYGLMSGALLNPRGFVRRLAELSGPSSQAWRVYAKDLGGLEANLEDACRAALHDFWPPALLGFVVLGLGLALFGKPGAGALQGRAARALPLVAGVSSFIFFTLAVARSEHRFMLPLGLLLSAYGGIGAGALVGSAAKLGQELAARVLVALGFAWAAFASFAVHLTQLGDARDEVAAYLAGLPAGSLVETYGLLVYQPRFDVSRTSPYRVERVGPDPARKRNPLVGAAEVEGVIADVQARRPDVLVLPEGFANAYLATGDDPARPLAQVIADRQRDDSTLRFVRAAVANRLPGYRLVVTAHPRLPAWALWLGLRPVPIQGTTGGSLWVLRREGVS
jgi:4-amino-4-deoxy-L-arabinose transferase-like glycosyltransferase